MNAVENEWSSLRRESIQDGVLQCTVSVRTVG